MSQLTDTNEVNLDDNASVQQDQFGVLREKDMNLAEVYNQIPKGNFKGLNLLKSHGPSYRVYDKENMID